MTYVLVGVIAVLAVMTVVSLVRGIATFLAATRQDLERGAADGPSALQLQQNRMMFARIRYQGLAIVVVALLLAITR